MTYHSHQLVSDSILLSQIDMTNLYRNIHYLVEGDWRIDFNIVAKTMPEPINMNDEVWWCIV
jgi:hypothetical protein